MGIEGGIGLGFWCSLEGAEINYKGSPRELVDRLLRGLAKPLGKRGITLQQQPSPEQAALRIRIVAIEQGNQLLRYLLPFIAPAFLEIEADLAPAGTPPESLHYKQTAQIGLFGGSASGMLGVCADRIAKKLSKDVLRRLG
jgi:hypothetical protein